MSDYLKIVGAHGDRRKNDFYPTPPECTIALLKFLEERFLIRKRDTIWEPACGALDMVKVMEQRGYKVLGTDIDLGTDYLTCASFDCEWIITNPPFSLAKEFIERSLQHNKPFAMLLKSQFWHSAKRYDLFTKHKPTFVLPLTWRPDFTGAGASLLDMLWVVWLGKSDVTYFQPLEKPKGDRKDAIHKAKNER